MRHPKCYALLLPRQAAGFTLIELLLALVMFAMIAGVIFASFGAVADGVDRGRQSADVYRVGRGVVQRILQELSTAVPPKDDPRLRFLGESAQEQELPRDRLTFVTVPYRRFSTKVPENEFCEVSYYIAENREGRPALFRSEDCTLEEEEERQEEQPGLELTDMAIALDFTYADAQEEHESWPPPDSEEDRPLPCRVRVALTLQDARQQPRVFFTTVPLVMRGACKDENQP